jgi:hypothetical protein
MNAAFSVAESAPPNEQKVKGRPCAKTGNPANPPAALAAPASSCNTRRLVNMSVLLHRLIVERNNADVLCPPRKTHVAALHRVISPRKAAAPHFLARRQGEPDRQELAQIDNLHHAGRQPAFAGTRESNASGRKIAPASIPIASPDAHGPMISVPRLVVANRAVPAAQSTICRGGCWTPEKRRDENVGRSAMSSCGAPICSMRHCA